MATLYRKLANLYRKQKERINNFKRGIPFNHPTFVSMTLDEDDIKIAYDWLNKPKSTWFEQDIVEQYHQTFAQWNGSKGAFSFMSGREALSACIFAIGLQPKDAVLIPAYTCVVVPNAFKFAGIEVIFCDIELDTYGLDVNQLAKKCTPNTKAILLQHLYGLVCRDYEAIINWARQNQLLVIEDCAHSTGAVYKGQKVGNYGDVAFYSSECSKVFNTIQGGIASSNQEIYLQKLKEYYDSVPFTDEIWIKKQLNNVPLHYYSYKYPFKIFFSDWAEWVYGEDFLISTTKVEEKGIKPAYYGRKMPAPIAHLGLNQLIKLDNYNQQRVIQANYWAKWSEEQSYKSPLIIVDSTPVFLRYPILVAPHQKENWDWAVKSIGLIPGVWFTSHTHPVHIAEFKDCPNAITAIKQCINLPTLLHKPRYF